MIGTLLGESTTLSLLLKEKLEEYLLAQRSVEELYSFYEQANSKLQMPDTEFILLRNAQKIVPDEIYKVLERLVGDEYQQIFRMGIGAKQKCKKILCSYLAYIAKTRYLLEADSKKQVDDFLPQGQQELLEFVRQHYLKSCFSCHEEVAAAIASDFRKPNKR